MKLSAAFGLAWRDVVATPWRSLVSMVGVALGVGVFGFVVALSLGVRGVVLDEVVQELPANIVEVVPRTIDFGIFKIDPSKLLGDRGFDDGTLNDLAQIDGVAEAMPRLEVRLPMHAQGGEGLFGRRLRSDFFLDGIPAKLLRADVGEGIHRTDVLPVVVSNQLLEIYNRSVAPALGTPELSASLLEGFEFRLQIGKSMLLGEKNAKQVGIERARIVGTSPYAMRFGATVTLEQARAVLQKYAKDPKERYRSVLLRLTGPSALDDVVRAVKERGYAVNETARRVGQILAGITAVGGLLGVMVLLLAAMSIAHSFLVMVRERQHDFLVLRSIGATPRDLSLLVHAQAVMLGAMGGVLGIVAGWLATWVCDTVALRFLPDFPFRPESFFYWSPGLVLVCVGLAILAAMAGAFGPARRVGKTALSRGLA